VKPIKEMIAVMEAHARGEKIEQYCLGKWVDVTIPLWNWSSCSYRIAPTPKLRAWKPEEVPVGALIRDLRVTFGAPAVVQILALRGAWIHFISPACAGLTSVLIQELDRNWQHSLDGGKTWIPCGVMEVEK